MKSRPTFDGITDEGRKGIGAGTEDGINNNIGAGSGGVTSKEDSPIFLPTFGG